MEQPSTSLQLIIHLHKAELQLLRKHCFKLCVEKVIMKGSNALCLAA